MKRVLPLLFLAVLAMAACKKAGYAPAPASMPPAAVSDVTAATSAANEAAKTSKPPAQPKPAAAVTGQTAPPAVALPMLAYSYDYGIEAPAGKIRALMGRQRAECEDAGPAQCQVTGANLTASGPDAATAKLTLKATPAWLKGYEDRLAAATQAGGGKLIQSSVTSEDLSRQIVDTDASVKAKTALRDRLLQMLQTRSGSLDELLQVQDKLAEVQGDLDATTSELAVMRERVATSDVTLEYSSTGVLAPHGVWAPVGTAVSSIAGILAGTIAAMIYLVAYLAPWAALVALILWLVRKRLPKLGRARPAPAVPPPAPKGD
jgi:hypothetical protein